MRRTVQEACIHLLGSDELQMWVDLDQREKSMHIQRLQILPTNTS